MKIIFPTIAFSHNGGSIYNDLVNCLLEHGHEIVICRSDSTVEYTVLEKINDKFQILNIKTGNQFEKNLIKKGINMLLLEKQFVSGIKKYLSNYNFDLVLYATPPISLNGVVKYCKEKYKANSFLMLKDIFPQNAIDLGMIKENSMIHKFFSNKEKKLYQLSDYIGCMSNKNKEYLNKYGKEIINKSHIFYNSIKIDDKIEKKVDYNIEYTTFLFGGNIGKPQNIDGLIEIIDNLKSYSKAKFIIVGKGTEDSTVKEYSRENSVNLTYIPYLEKREYIKLLDSADVGLISLDPRFTIANIPSKLPTYYNLQKPVLAITDAYTDLKDMILDEDCGWWCNASNKQEIIDCIKEICESKEKQIQKGLNAFNYAKKYFDVEINVKQIEKFMEENKDESI